MAPVGLPTQQLGVVLPLGTADGLYHGFYAVAGFDVNLVGYPGGLTQFTASAGAQALEGSWPVLEFLAGREVDRIVIGGLPVATSVPRPDANRLCDQATKRLGVPVTTDAEDTVSALRQLGARRVVLATKWSGDVMAGVTRYLGDAGIEVVRSYGLPHTPQGVAALKPRESYDIALALGDGALADPPEADAFLLGGGAWFVLPAVPVIEQRHGLPVVNNIGAMVWATLRDFGRAPVAPGWGRLLDGLAPRPA